MSLLTIAIPTFNRCKKLRRLLKIIENEIINSRLTDHVRVLVSDNASSDDTSETISEFKHGKINLTYYCQSTNLGFDRNVMYLYENIESEYVWFFSDDDIPLPGSIHNVFQTLMEEKPDVLLFSFIQPPESKERCFKYNKEKKIIGDPAETIKLLNKYPKVSIYILRKILLTQSRKEELKPFINSGFIFISLAYTVLNSFANPKLGIISKPLATCDKDYNNFNFNPDTFLYMYKVYEHPFVKKHLPNRSKNMIDKSYYVMIQFLFAVKLGVLKVDDIIFYNNYIKKIRWRYSPLMKNPKSLVQLILLKNNLVWIYPGRKKLKNIFLA